MWDTIDYEAVVDHKYKWKNKSLETILKAPFHNGFALTPLEKLINDNIDEEAIRNNPIKGGLVFTERFFKYRIICARIISLYFGCLKYLSGDSYDSRERYSL